MTLAMISKNGNLFCVLEVKAVFQQKGTFVSPLFQVKRSICQGCSTGVLLLMLVAELAVILIRE